MSEIDEIVEMLECNKFQQIAVDGISQNSTEQNKQITSCWDFEVDLSMIPT